MPKDINRNEYLKRINQIIENLKSQKDAIKVLLTDITDNKKDTEKNVL